MAMTKQELIELCRELLDKYAQELGIPERFYKTVVISLSPYKTRLASVKITDRGPVVRWLRVNSIFLDFFKIDEQRAMKVLRYVIAHETAHIWQRFNYTIKQLIVIPRFSRELEADKIAEKLVGYSSWEMESELIWLLNHLGQEAQFVVPKFLKMMY